MSLLLLPTPPIDKPKGRIHRLRDDYEEDQPEDPTRPAILPIVAGDAEGNLLLPGKGMTMPKGHYDRTKAKPRATAANEPTEAATPRKPGRKPKAAKKTGTPAVARSGKPRLVVEKGESGFTVTFEGMTQDQVATLIAAL